MRHYEAMVISAPQLMGEKLDQVKKVFDELVVKHGGRVLGNRDLGKRSFGFVVKKQREGNYTVMDFDLDPSKISDLKKALTLTEIILRFSIFIKQAAVVSLAPQSTTGAPKPPVAPTRV